VKSLRSDYFAISFVLGRVLNSGIVMSIEKNEKELSGLEKIIKKKTNTKYVSLFNSYTGAVHGALFGQDIVFGDKTRLNNLTDKEKKFIKWLGIDVVSDKSIKIGFLKHGINWKSVSGLEGFNDKCKVGVLDFTELGFGPCAAMITNEELVWKKAERLKIFGAYDLKTMWTQEESEPALAPAVQFNYRLSPLVAACAKLSIIRGAK
jgi:hypothetical protein